VARGGDRRNVRDGMRASKLARRLGVRVFVVTELTRHHGPRVDRDAEGAAFATRLRDRDQFQRALSDAPPRIAYERELASGHLTDEHWAVPGYCQACDRAGQLEMGWDFSDGRTPNWREWLRCAECGLNNRQRFVAHLAQALGPQRVYVHERVTPFYSWALDALPEVTGSEYLGHDLEPGTEIDGVRHEDALRLSFPDDSFDLIVSNDVFEHVPDIDRCLHEVVRVLRPGGRLLFSVPFHSDRDEVTRRADLVDGAVVELLEAEYHPNPVSEKGSLVFYDYGWDLLDLCRRAGFDDACSIGYWSALHGYLGGGLQLVFEARRD
jgi:SAM-dependent methyltransferase